MEAGACEGRDAPLGRQALPIHRERQTDSAIMIISPMNDIHENKPLLVIVPKSVTHF